MTTIQQRAAATPDEDRWCSACAGTGVIEDWCPTCGHRDPDVCPDCQGCGWFDAAGEPADPPRRRHVGQEIAVMLGLFAVLALAGWLIDTFWPAAAALAIAVCIFAWKARTWML